MLTGIGFLQSCKLWSKCVLKLSNIQEVDYLGNYIIETMLLDEFIENYYSSISYESELLWLRQRGCGYELRRIVFGSLFRSQSPNGELLCYYDRGKSYRERQLWIQMKRTNRMLFEHSFLVPWGRSTLSNCWTNKTYHYYYTNLGSMRLCHSSLKKYESNWWWYIISAME